MNNFHSNSQQQTATREKCGTHLRTTEKRENEKLKKMSIRFARDSVSNQAKVQWECQRICVSSVCVLCEWAPFRVQIERRRQLALIDCFMFQFQVNASDMWYSIITHTTYSIHSTHTRRHAVFVPSDAHNIQSTQLTFVCLVTGVMSQQFNNWINHQSMMN